jgi:putative sigma-54 modulation protein
MILEITGRNIDVTPALREFTSDKLSKLRRCIDEIIETHVILNVEKHRHVAEIVVKARHQKFTGIEETGDMYASIGNAVDKIEKQARRAKDKVTTRRKHARPAHDVAAEGDGEMPSEAALEPGARPRIIRTDDHQMKPMSAEDAALEFARPGREFLVYRDARTQRISIMYRRRDGNLGLIEPEDQ